VPTCFETSHDPVLKHLGIFRLTVFEGRGTNTVPLVAFRTVEVRFGVAARVFCVICATVSAIGWTADVVAEDAKDAARASAIQRTQAAEGWLTLDRDQREARAAAGPLSSGTWQDLQILEQQERTRYRETLQAEGRELDAERRRERRASVPAGTLPGSEARLQGRLLDQQRAQESQRLRMQMDRRTRGLPTPGAGAP